MASLRELTVTELKERLDRYATEQQAKGDTEAQMLHELQVYQIELEMQNRELRETQQQLEASRNRYAELYDFAPIGYISLTPKGVIREVNMTAAIMLAQEPHRLVGFPLLYYIETDYRSVYMNHLLRCQDATRTVTELVLRCAEDPVPVELTSLRYDDPEFGILYRTAITDIRERKLGEAILRETNEQLDRRVQERTAELEQANMRLHAEIGEKEKLADALQRQMRELDDLHHRKDEFLAMLAHELRNPLASLTTGLHLFKLESGSIDAYPQWTEMMERQLKQMVRLVDDLLDVSRVLSGKIVLQPQRTDLRAVVRHAIEQSAERIRQRNHELQMHFSEEAIWVDVDDVRLQQVIANLLNNAAKFTEPGGHIDLQVTTERDEAVLRVIDDGPGIPRDLLPHVFDLFTQGERTLDRSSGGLGIGLTLANNLVHLHGGYIQAFSEGEGRGAEFVVRLPLRTRAENKPQAPQASNDNGKKNAQRILVVDDNEDMAKSTAAILRIWGHTVECAHSGLTALDMLRNSETDTILLDIGLPDMDGYAIAQRIREIPELRGAIVIAVSGYGAEDYKRRAFEAGFDEYFVKPLDLNQLRNYLNRIPSLH